MNKILIGITGGISAYKIPELIRELKKNSFEVKVVLTQMAKNFVTPFTLHSVGSSVVYDDLIDCNDSESAMRHIELSRWADMVLVAPASANFIAKLACGLSDDLLTTICLATSAPITVVPAMNKQMWDNVATQCNIKTLQERKISVVGPDYGVQACGDIGFGRMVEPLEIMNYVLHMQHTNNTKYLSGVNILITAGGTQESIDPVRYIGNHSSGKMGYAIAKVAVNLGANVTLITAKTYIDKPHCKKTITVTNADEMLLAVEDNIQNQDIFISCAAVADYKVTNVSHNKIKKSEYKKLTLELEPNIDILATIAKKYKLFTVGFVAETNNLIENAQNKLINKNLDLVIANDVSLPDIGFNSDYNEVYVVSEDIVHKIDLMTKDLVAIELLKIIYQQWVEKPAIDQAVVETNTKMAL